jgi:thiamine biosynthesis protein ThiS
VKWNGGLIGRCKVLKVWVNGKPKELECPQDLASFLDGYGLNIQFIAVAYNGEVLATKVFPDIILDDGDVVEIVRPVGGG